MTRFGWLPVLPAMLGAVLIGGIMLGGNLDTASAGAIDIISTEQEVELGRQLALEIEKEEKVLSDADVQGYVQRIGERLARVTTRHDLQYTFRVIDAPKTVNAFAIPGGNMYVYTGLMKACGNEAELAAVMAHEMGHVAARHHGQTLTREYGLDLLMSIILGKNRNETGKLAGQLLGKTVAMRFSREQEREADALGMEFLFCAGYRPEAMLTFMNKMVAAEQKNGGGNWLPIFSSHPPTEKRLAILQSLVQKYPPNLRAANQLYAERYQQTVLSKLP